MCKTEDEAILKAQTEALHIGLVDFEGMNCNDWEYKCGGWDGVSRRCDCGNRRVYWETFKRDDGTFGAAAVAF